MFPESAQNYRNGEGAKQFFDVITTLLDCTGTKERPYEIMKGGRVLDVGTGCGYMVKHLQEHGVDAYGLEGDDVRVRFARSIARTPEKIIHADARQMPFPDGYFDIALSTMIYDHQLMDFDPIFLDPCTLLKIPTYQAIAGGLNRNSQKDSRDIQNEIRRVLRPGGLYLLRDMLSSETIVSFENFETLTDNPTFIALRKPTHPTQ